MTRKLPALLVMTLALAVVTLIPVSGFEQTPAAVQVTAADAKVRLSADTSSAVVSAVPVGATLEVVGASGNYFQVKLPKDSSGFDRVGFIPKSQVKAMAGVARPAASGAESAAPAGSSRPLTAVLPFDYGTIQQWWSGTWDIGKGVADMMVDQLLSTGQVRIVERAKLEGVLSEQDLAASHRADPSAKQTASIGKVLGAKVLITGSITKFGGEESNVGGAAGAAAGKYFGGAGAKNTTATVALTVRAVDATTSEVLASVKGEAKSSRKGILLGSSVAGNFGAIDMTKKDFRETILGEATEKAVKDAATKLVAALQNAMR